MERPKPWGERYQAAIIRTELAVKNDAGARWDLFKHFNEVLNRGLTHRALGSDGNTRVGDRILGLKQSKDLRCGHDTVRIRDHLPTRDNVAIFGFNMNDYHIGVGFGFLEQILLIVSLEMIKIAYLDS